MDVVILLVFISLILVAAGLAFFLYRLREGDFDRNGFVGFEDFLALAANFGRQLDHV